MVEQWGLKNVLENDSKEEAAKRFHRKMSALFEFDVTSCRSHAKDILFPARLIMKVTHWLTAQLDLSTSLIPQAKVEIRSCRDTETLKHPAHFHYTNVQPILTLVVH